MDAQLQYFPLLSSRLYLIISENHYSIEMESVNCRDSILNFVIQSSDMSVETEPIFQAVICQTFNCGACVCAEVGVTTNRRMDMNIAKWDDSCCE